MLFSAKNNLNITGDQSVANPNAGEVAEAPCCAGTPESKPAISAAATNFLQKNITFNVLKMYGFFLFKSGKYETKKEIADIVGKVASATMDNGDLTSGELEDLLNCLDRELVIDTLHNRMERHLAQIKDHMICRICCCSPEVVETFNEEEKKCVSKAMSAWQEYMAASSMLDDLFGKKADELICGIFEKYKSLFDQEFVSMFCKK